jgi:hypothetical protein
MFLDGLPGLVTPTLLELADPQQTAKPAHNTLDSRSRRPSQATRGKTDDRGGDGFPMAGNEW